MGANKATQKLSLVLEGPLAGHELQTCSHPLPPACDASSKPSLTAPRIRTHQIVVQGDAPADTHPQVQRPDRNKPDPNKDTEQGTLGQPWAERSRRRLVWSLKADLPHSLVAIKLASLARSMRRGERLDGTSAPHRRNAPGGSPGLAGTQERI